MPLSKRDSNGYFKHDWDLFTETQESKKNTINDKRED